MDALSVGRTNKVRGDASVLFMAIGVHVSWPLKDAGDGIKRRFSTAHIGAHQAARGVAKSFKNASEPGSRIRLCNANYTPWPESLTAFEMAHS